MRKFTRRSYLSATGLTGLGLASLAFPHEIADLTNDDSDGFVVSINPIGDVTEGTVVSVQFTVRNPTEETLTETVTLRRDSWKTLYNEKLTLHPGESKTITRQWHVRHDAGGHAMQLIMEAEHDTATAFVTASSPILPSITSVESDVENHTVTVSYLVENTGSAPSSTTVTVKLNDQTIETHNVHLAIGGEQRFTVTFDHPDDEFTINVSTNVSTASHTSSKTNC